MVVVKAVVVLAVQVVYWIGRRFVYVSVFFSTPDLLL
jgi:hypothetical protein